MSIMEVDYLIIDMTKMAEGNLLTQYERFVYATLT